MLGERADGPALVAANEYSEQRSATYKVTDLTSDTILCEGEVTVTEDGLTDILRLTDDGENRFLLIEWMLDEKSLKIIM